MANHGFVHLKTRINGDRLEAELHKSMSLEIDVSDEVLASFGLSPGAGEARP